MLDAASGQGASSQMAKNRCFGEVAYGHVSDGGSPLPGPSPNSPRNIALQPVRIRSACEEVKPQRGRSRQSVMSPMAPSSYGDLPGTLIVTTAGHPQYRNNVARTPAPGALKPTRCALRSILVGLAWLSEHGTRSQMGLNSPVSASCLRIHISRCGHAWCDDYMVELAASGISLASTRGKFLPHI